MSANKETVKKYIDVFNKNDHDQMLSGLADGIEWTVFPRRQGSLRQRDRRPDVHGSAGLEHRSDSEVMRKLMGEVFVIRDAKIAERRAFLVELKENEYK